MGNGAAEQANRGNTSVMCGVRHRRLHGITPRLVYKPRIHARHSASQNIGSVRKPMFSILVVGRDDRLLATRAAVLSRMTPHIEQAIPSVALNKLSEHGCDLVVLCHSLTVEESAEIANAAHAKSEKIRVIQVLALANARTGYEDIPADDFSEAEPSALVEKARRLMNGFDNSASRNRDS